MRKLQESQNHISNTTICHFAPLVGTGNTAAGDYRTTLTNSSYLWSYGCGAGSFTSCSGIGTTVNMAGDSLKTVFTHALWVVLRCKMIHCI